MRTALNGRFLAAPRTGVQRFAGEVTTRLVAREDVVLYVPAAVEPPEAAAEGPIRRGRLGGNAWEQLELPRAAAADGCECVLNLANTAPLWGPPTVVVLHDVFALTRPEWYSTSFSTWYRFAQPRWTRRARAVVTTTRWAAGEIARVLRIDSGRIHVVGQGVEPFHEPATDDQVARVRAKRGLNGPYVLAMGGRDPRKNLDFLQEVWRLWPGGDPPTLVTVERDHGVGPGANRGPARAATAGGGSGARSPAARRLRDVSDDELRALYTSAAAFAFPSLAEGFGRPPLEAMGCGAPVVAAPYGAATEVLGDAACVAPLDASVWALRLAEIVSSPEAAASLRDRGRERASHYRWDSVVTRVLEACGQLGIEGGASGVPGVRAGLG